MSSRTNAFAEQIYRDYYPVLRRRCWKLLRDESLVDDAMQDIFWTICRHGSQYRGEMDAVLPWLYRVTTTHCFKLLERDRRWSRNIELAFEEGTIRYNGNLTREEVEQKLVVKELLLRLPGRQREAILYRYVSGMTQQEIAEVMEVSRDQVRLWLSQFEQRGEKWREEVASIELEQNAKSKK